jgi:hypothetical protein
MPTLTNSFETGAANGTTVTQAASANGSAGNIFDAVSIAGTNTMVYSTAHPAHGTLGTLITIGASAAQACYVEWSTSLLTGTSSASIYTRSALYKTANPATTLPVIRGLQSTTQRWRVSITATGNVIFANGANTTIGTSALALSNSTTYRIEASVAASATAGSCVAEIRIYAGDSTTPLETMGPGGAYTGWTAGGPIDRVRLGVGAAASPVTASAYYADDFGASTVAWLGPAVPAAVVDHVWLGNLSDTSVTLAAGVRNIAAARLKVSTAADLSTSPVFSSSVAPNADGSVKLTRASLTASTSYYYGIEADGVMLPTVYGPFKTLPTAGAIASHTIVFGSCNQTNSNTPTFAAMAAYTGLHGAPVMAFHEGDLHYRDWGVTATASDIATQYKSSLGASNLQALVSKFAMPYVWDNHDWGGQFSNASAPAGPLLAAAYRAWVPHHTLPTAGSTLIYHAFTIGRVRYIVLDTRAGRSAYNDPEGPSKSLLGTEQKTWLKTELVRSEPVKIIVCGIYWRRDASGGDRWGSYTTEFDEINAYIATNNVNAYVIFGDRHALCADDGSSFTASGMPQAGGAPFHQGSVVQPNSEPWTAGYYDTGGASMQAFGALDVTDSGASITVAYKGITSLDSIVRVSMSIEFETASALVGGWGIPAMLS